MRPVTLQRASHTEAGIGRFFPPPSLRKYPATRAGGGWRLESRGLWRSSAKIRPDSGTMGELSLISANNLPQEDGHLCQHHFKFICMSTPLIWERKATKNLGFCVGSLLPNDAAKWVKKELAIFSFLRFSHFYWHRYLENLYFWRGKIEHLKSETIKDVTRTS